MKNTIQFISISLVLFASCSAVADMELLHGKIEEGIYTNEKFNWTVKIPENWQLDSKSIVEYETKKGRESNSKFSELGYKDSFKTMISLSALTLQRNVFAATYSSFKNEHGRDYNTEKDLRFKQTIDVFQNMGFHVDKSQSTVSIDNLEFHHLSCSLELESKRVYFKLYERKFPNDEILAISITTHDNENMEEIKKALFDSKFQKAN